MAKLHFSLDGNSLGEFALDKERITIGRRPSNDIHIDNLAVSGDHATITTIGNDSFLEDLNSTNGTLVNDKPVKKHVLHHNDVIEIGKYQLRYENLAQEKTPANRNGFENTVVMRPARLVVPAPEIEADIEKDVDEKGGDGDSVTPTPTPVLTSVPVAAAIQAAAAEPTQKIPVDTTGNAQKIGHLQVLNGTNSGRELSLNKALTTLGKPGVQVAVITKRPHGYFIAHVEGEKHPIVNGQSVGMQAYALNDHDVIDLSGVKMEFYLA
ncbi:MAG: FHA domain-containing protein [Methylotenera sp.]